MKRLVIFLTLIAQLNACALFRQAQKLTEEPIECTGFTLVGHYWAYDVRAAHLLNNSRLLEYQREPLINARQAVKPFVQPTALAAVELAEFYNLPYRDESQQIVLERNMEFWVEHLRPHVEVLINTVRSTRLTLE